MKEKITILVINKTGIVPAEQKPGRNGSTGIHTFAEPHLAKEYLDNYLLAEKMLIAERLGKKPEDILLIPAEQTVRRRIVEEQSGEQTFNILANRYDISWRTLPAQYNVSDEEFKSTLDAYVNSNRGVSDYQKMAEDISATMHRYCQNELWKFVKALIRAFAQGRWDERNKTAHDQAADLAAFLEAENIR